MKHNLNKAVQNFLYAFRKANNAPVVNATPEMIGGALKLQENASVAEIKAYLASPVHFGKGRVSHKVAEFGKAVQAYFDNVARYKGIKPRLPRTYTVVKIQRPRKVVPVTMKRGLRAF